MKLGDRHGASANAGEALPTELSAVFVVDTNERAPTMPSGD